MLYLMVVFLFDQSVKVYEKACGDIIKITNGNDTLGGCLLDYPSLKEH